MKTREAMSVIAAHRRNAIAVCALGMASNEWWQATKSEEAFYVHGAMGFAASFALGFALMAPDVPVLLLNADGSLCINLGCLLPKRSRHQRTSSISSSTTESIRRLAQCQWSTVISPITLVSPVRPAFRVP